jgi:hypothetical protein
MKIHPLAAELFHADRHDDANSLFSQFFERALQMEEKCGKNGTTYLPVLAFQYPLDLGRPRQR